MSNASALAKATNGRSYVKCGLATPVSSRVLEMNKSELMFEFMAILAETVGADLSYEQAGYCVLVMEKLHNVSVDPIFKSKLKESIAGFQLDMLRFYN